MLRLVPQEVWSYLSLFAMLNGDFMDNIFLNVDWNRLQGIEDAPIWQADYPTLGCPLDYVLFYFVFSSLRRPYWIVLLRMISDLPFCGDLRATPETS